VLCGFEAFTVGVIVVVRAHADRDIAPLVNGRLCNRAVAKVTVGVWSYSLLVMNFVWDSLFLLNQACR